MDQFSPAEVFPHIRILLGTVIGLGLTRLLMKLAGFVQHPEKNPPSLLHLLWVGSLIIELVLFWWWQLALVRIETWTFGVTIFLVSYAMMMFFLCALLSPDSIAEYDSYEHYFLSRRKWFFGFFAAVAVLDVLDTIIKGPERLERMGPSYVAQPVVGILVCILGWKSRSRAVHLTIVCVHYVYQLFLVSRYFYG